MQIFHLLLLLLLLLLRLRAALLPHGRRWRLPPLRPAGAGGSVWKRNGGRGRQKNPEKWKPKTHPKPEKHLISLNNCFSGWERGWLGLAGLLQAGGRSRCRSRRGPGGSFVPVPGGHVCGHRPGVLGRFSPLLLKGRELHHSVCVFHNSCLPLRFLGENGGYFLPSPFPQQ